MIFDKYCIEKILTGEKTVTRRKRNSSRRPAIPGHIHKLKIDRTNKTFGTILIKSCIKENYPQITWEEAFKEGFKTPDEYYKYFCDVNKISHGIIPTWRIEFELIEGAYRD